MAARHLTMRGEPIDMASLAANNSATRALGNANMNARGDIIGQGGTVLKTQEQIEAEWAAEKAKKALIASNKKANIKSSLNDITKSEATPDKQVDVSDADFEPTNEAESSSEPVQQPVAQTKSKRRRITDAA